MRFGAFSCILGSLMAWTPGTRLGPYEILAPIGAGGMGEVHRARDTRLNRDVAIKAIPAALAGEEQVRQRFEREAKAISSLNHPHICTLYDVGVAPVEAGESAPRHYLVMELLEGESLADRLTRGALPLHETLKFGRQIASALDAAHRQGIVHRDLKPGNVMLTKSGAKLLDFGLARTATGVPSPLSGLSRASSQLATAMEPEARPLTTEGTILGTFQYMAPEQLEGSEADARTDIFALGALLYEMATGRRAFSGANKTSLIASIVSSQPPLISSVMPMSPPALDHVMRRCLEKDPDDRWQSAHDVAAELQWVSEAGSQAGVAVPVTVRRKTQARLGWVVAGAFAILSLSLGALYLARPSAPHAALRATIAPPADNALIPFDFGGLALSPDGTTLAFVATGPGGTRQIWLRNLARMEARLVEQTTGASYPFWSPDGQSLGYFADQKLKTIDLRGGAPRTLADAPSGRGGSWGADGTLLFAPNISSPIHRIAAAGGKSEPVSQYDPGTEVTHRWPVLLPGNNHFIYVSRTRSPERSEVGRLMLSSLDGGEATLLIDDASNALYVAPGYILYGREGSLYARRFDAASLRLEGEAIPVVPEELSFWEPKNFIPMTASDNGTIVYLPDATRPSEMRWYDRQGRPLEALGPPGFQFAPRVSPDGRKVVYSLLDAPQGQADLWIHDLEFDRSFRLSQQSGDYAGASWAPDSDRIAFLCQLKGVPDLCMMSMSSGGEMKTLYQSNTWKTTGGWHPDGKRLLFSPQDPETGQDLAILPVDGGEPTMILRTPFREDSPEVARDGIRIAYESDQTGRSEIYVRNIDGSPGQWQISTDGGYQPRWRNDGKELFYAAADGFVMAAPLQIDPFRPGSPVRLFQMPERPEDLGQIFEDISPDGQRLLLNVPTSGRTTIGFHVVFNWTALIDAPR